MKRAVLFKIFIASVSNHNRIRRHLVRVFFQDYVEATYKRLKSVQQLMKINLFMKFAWM